MQFTNYFFASVISFSGLVIGTWLIKTAPEEQKPLKKYFAIMKAALLLLIFAFLAVYYFNDYYNLLILAAFFVLAVFSEYKISGLYRRIASIYLLFGALFFLSSKNMNLFAIESSLIFLYGASVSSLVYSRKDKNIRKAVFYSAGFIILANILFIMQLPFFISYF